MSRLHRLAWQATRRLPILPIERRRRIERLLRGGEETRKLACADCAVVSPAKSGRTWLRVMLTRYFQKRYGLPNGALLDGDNLRRLNFHAPAVLFTHDNYVRDYLGCAGATAAYARRRVVLLVRHPADVAVSGYFQWRHRMTPNKRALDGLPPGDAEIALDEYVMGWPGSLRRIIAKMNRWAGTMRSRTNLIVVRYEDMRANPETELARILEFMGYSPLPEALRDAVDHASLDNMRQLEASGAYARSGRALRPGRDRDVNASKVRRGKVGGYRNYFSPKQISRIEAQIANRLDPVFGYSRAPVEQADRLRQRL